MQHWYFHGQITIYAVLPCSIDVSMDRWEYTLLFHAALMLPVRWHKRCSSMQHWCLQTYMLLFYVTLIFSNRWEYPNLFRAMLMLPVKWEYTLLFHVMSMFPDRLEYTLFFHAALMFPDRREYIYCTLIFHAALMFPDKWEYTLLFHATLMLPVTWHKRCSSMQHWNFHEQMRIYAALPCTIDVSMDRWEYTLLCHAALELPWTDENIRCSSMQHWCFHGQLRICMLFPCIIDVTSQMTINTALPCSIDVSSQMTISAVLLCMQRWCFQSDDNECCSSMHATLMFPDRWKYTLLFHVRAGVSSQMTISAALLCMQRWCFQTNDNNAALPCNVDVSRQMRILYTLIFYAALVFTDRREYRLLFHAALMSPDRWEYTLFFHATLLFQTDLFRAMLMLPVRWEYTLLFHAASMSPLAEDLHVILPGISWISNTDNFAYKAHSSSLTGISVLWDN